MNVTTFLSYLDQARSNGQNKWQARCPGHDDKSPSLAIKEADNGNILLHCFAGCTTDEIVGALGLKMNDLFADDKPYTKAPGKPRRKLEQALMHELFVLHIAINSRLERKPIHEYDKDRELLSVKRITALIKDIY